MVAQILMLILLFCIVSGAPLSPELQSGGKVNQESNHYAVNSDSSKAHLSQPSNQLAADKNSKDKHGENKNLAPQEKRKADDKHISESQRGAAAQNKGANHAKSPSTVRKQPAPAVKSNSHANLPRKKDDPGASNAVHESHGAPAEHSGQPEHGSVQPEHKAPGANSKEHNGHGSEHGGEKHEEMKDMVKGFTPQEVKEIKAFCAKTIASMDSPYHLEINAKITEYMSNRFHRKFGVGIFRLCEAKWQLERYKMSLSFMNHEKKLCVRIDGYDDVPTAGISPG